MTPIGEQFGAGFLSAYVGEGKNLSLTHNEGAIQVELTGTENGGHVKLVENGDVKIDTDLVDGATAEYIARNGDRVLYAGGANRDKVEKAIAGIENYNLPSLQE